MAGTRDRHTGRPYIRVYALDDGSEDVHSDRNYADDPESTIHNGNERIRVVEMDRYSNSPEEGWTITADWTVQSINDYP